MLKIFLNDTPVCVPAGVQARREEIDVSALKLIRQVKPDRVAVYRSGNDVIKHVAPNSAEQSRIFKEIQANINILTVCPSLRNHCVLMTHVYVTPDTGVPYAIGYKFSGLCLHRHPSPPNRTLYDVVRLAAGAAHSLAALHWARCIHGDVKPGNILWDEQAARAYMCDIETVGVGRDDMNSDFYTTMYASPSVIRLHNKTKSDDVYAFGFVLYYLLTHTFVFAKQPPAKSKDGNTCAYYARLSRDCYRPAIPLYTTTVSAKSQELFSAYLRLVYACMNRVSSERPEMPTVAYVLQNMLYEEAALKETQAPLPVLAFLQAPRKRPAPGPDSLPDVNCLAGLRYNDSFDIGAYAGLPVVRISGTVSSDANVVE
jgi:serine/threonine protein kinase